MCFLQKLPPLILFAGAAVASSTPTDDSKPPSLNKYISPLLDSFRSSPSSRSFHPAASPFDRTIDLSSLGIDLGDIFDRLLSPAGIVQQFVLTLTLVVFRTVGWVLASFGYNSIIGSLPAGPITDLVRTLDIVLTPQAIAQTLARDALRTVWDLAARIITTATLFGVFESVSQIVATTTIEGLWRFITGERIATVMVLRFVFMTAFFAIGFFILMQLGMAIDLSAFGRRESSQDRLSETASLILSALLEK